MNIQDINRLIARLMGHDPGKLRKLDVSVKHDGIPRIHTEEIVTDIDPSELIAVLEKVKDEEQARRIEQLQEQIKKHRDTASQQRSEVLSDAQEFRSRLYALENPPKKKRKKKK